MPRARHDGGEMQESRRRRAAEQWNAAVRSNTGPLCETHRPSGRTDRNAHPHCGGAVGAIVSYALSAIFAIGFGYYGWATTAAATT